MKKVPFILAIMLGVLDAALVAGIVLLFLQSGTPADAAAADSQTAAWSDSFESNEETYQNEDRKTEYGGIVQAGSGLAVRHRPRAALQPETSRYRLCRAEQNRRQRPDLHRCRTAILFFRAAIRR